MSDEDIKVDEKTLKVLKKKGYKIEERLSAGAFGQVFKAVKESTGVLSAVKIMDLEKVSAKFKNKFLPRELATLMEVDHKHIVKTFDIFRSNKKIYVFMEFIDGGDVSGHLKNHGAMDEPSAWKWFAQIADALNYMHNTLLMAHRDIKIDNILLSKDKETAKLTDFGFSKESWDQETNKVILSDSYCGTEPYYCPELLKQVKYDPFKADVWALGVVLFAMLTNKFPFHFNDKKTQIKEQENERHVSSRFGKNVSKHLKELFPKLFEIQESKRIGINDVLNQRWIKEKGICKH